MPGGIVFERPEYFVARTGMVAGALQRERVEMGATTTIGEGFACRGKKQSGAQVPTR